MRAQVWLMKAVPRRRASRADSRSAKNTQTCAPRPEREISNAAGTPNSAHDCNERQGVLLPLGLVKIDREEVAGVTLQQRIDPHGVLACQMVVDHRIRQREQQPVAACRRT